MAGRGRSSPAIGIDLGTTYSCAAVWQNNRAEVIPNGSGNRTTPSVVSFFQSEILAGEDAQVNAHRNASNTIYEIKRLMGRRFRDEHVRKDMNLWHFRVVEAAGGRPKVVVQIQGEERQYTPEEISSMILSKIRQFAESFLGTTVDRAVVTVPAYFTDLQRRATRDAALIAGFDVLRIINEPTAAAVAYGLDTMSESGARRILVFDLGGGTLDVTVALLNDGKLEVNATAGDGHLGGEDFDYRMVRFLAEEFRKKHGLDISRNPKALRRLKNECERAKRLLSFQHSTTVFVDSLMDGTDMEMKISRAKFEELNMDLFDKCLPLVERCLRDAGIEKEAVDEVVLVGGSTRIPKIREMLRELLNKDSMCPNQSMVNPDEAVALGAAILAAKHAGEGDEPPHELVLLDVTPLSLGVETHGGVMTVLIPRNTPIPVMKEMVFSTAVDQQTEVQVKVFEGERSMTRDNNLLGVFVLAGIEPAPGRVPHIVVSFLVDENGILRVTAEDKRRGHREGMVVSNEHGRAWAEEIERMVEEAEAHRREDEARRKEVEAWNRLESFVCSVRRKMGSGKLSNLSGDDEELVETALSTATALLADKDQLSGAEEVENVRMGLETLWTDFLAHRGL